MEQISAAFLTEECSAILQNKLTPKLGDPKSFLILCKFANSVEYLALSNLVASVNLMSYSLYAALSGTTLKHTRISNRLANHTYQYLWELLRICSFKLGNSCSLSILLSYKWRKMIEIGEDRATFLIDKAMQHSHLNNDTCVRIDVINEITEDEIDALLDDSKPFLNPPTDLEMKPLSKHLEFSFLEENSLFPVGLALPFANKINFEDDGKLVNQRQCRLNPKMKEVVKKEIIKLLDAGIIYAIEDSPWVSAVHCVPNKGGMTVMTNEDNELVPTRTVTRWRVCIDYHKLNEDTRKDHFPLPFMDQMLERLA
ncbi:hypothetical protein Tco_1268742 [Tanacetum coccineum]